MAKKQFKAESKRLLDLMINSIYTHKEIFLRELISNASDAIDKLAYLALTDEAVGLNRSDFAIRLAADKDARTLTVSDNGIGMSREEMEENLGTIAHSGSLGFKTTMEKQDDIDIIGQFGVGFYSAFMVADKVTVISKKYGSDEAWKWESSGADGYTITPCEKDAAGTDVIMTLKEDTEDEKYSDYLGEYRLRSLVKKYSDYIRYPIKMLVETRKPVGEPKEGEEQQYETVQEEQTLNSMVPIWQKNKKDVTDEEYLSFYRDKFFDYEAPAGRIHISVEGAVTYKALLYIPAKAPYDFYTKDYKSGLQLYSSGVMIMDNCADLLPEHFRFVRGVVDTQDLSLNISREMLQHTRELKTIAANLEKKIKAELLRLLENERETYEKFYASFGRQLKYGLVSDYGMHKELLQDLLLFRSDKEGKLVSLKEYCAPREQRQAEQRHERLRQKFEFFLLHALKNRLHRQQKHGFDDGKQRIRAFRHEIAIAVGHHAVALGAQKARHSEEIDQRPGQQRSAHGQAPAVAPQQPLEQHIQADDGHIDRRVLLDQQRQQGKDHRAADAPPLQAVEQPQKQRREENVFVQVIARARGVGRVGQQQPAQQRRNDAGKAVAPRNAPERDDRRGQHRRLQQLQRDGGGEHRKHRQHQIIDRRNMHRKMRQQPVTLERRVRQTGRAHAVEHLGKNTHVIGRARQRKHPAGQPQADIGKKQRREHRRERFSAPAARGRYKFDGTLLRALARIDSQQYQHQHARAQQRQRKRRGQRHGGIPDENGQQQPAHEA